MSRRPAGPVRGASQEIARLLAEGVRWHRQGNLAKADVCYRRVLRLDARQPDALHLSGLIAHQAGDSRAALSRIEAAIAVDEACAAYHNSRGVVLLALDRPVEAEADFRRALDRDPVYAEALNNLGNALQRQDRNAEAVAAYDRALEVQPAYAEAWCNRGRTQHLAGDAGDAVASLRQAIALRPDWAKAQRYLGDATAAAGDRAEAEACYRRALDHDPADAETHASLAALLERSNRPDDALAAAETALTHDPRSLRATVIAARALRRLGREADALAKLDACFATPDASAEDRASAAFERGQILDRQGRYATAYDAFADANRLLGETPAARRADRAMFPQLIRRLGDRFDAAWVASWREAAPNDARADPVFLIGFPRSGTTLLDQILDSHPALSTMEEKDTLDRVRQAVGRRPGGYPEALADLDAESLRDLRSLYFTEAARHVGDLGGRMLIDKMPLNSIDAGLIHRLFPQARFLLALRHPCDVVLSGFMQAMQPNAAMVLLDSLESAARFYADVMGLWRHYRAVLPLRVLEVRYEDLVADLPGQARRMLGFLEVPWDDAVLNYADHAKTRAIATPSYHQVVQPIYRRAVGRWRNYAFAFEQALPLLQPLARDFGYPVDDASA